jgi:exopolysaccharide production protein ExoZ
MMFYVIFAAALLAPLRWRAALCTLAFALFAASRLLPGYEQSALLKFYAYPIVFEFVAGMLVGHLYLSRAQLPRLASLALMLAGFALLLTEALEPPGASAAKILVTHGLPSTMIVLGGVMFDKGAANPTVWRVPAALGDASYSIYLSHIFTLGVARKLWESMGLAQDDALHAWGFAAFGMLAVCVSSLICYRLLERPAQDIGQRTWRALKRGDGRVATA